MAELHLLSPKGFRAGATYAGIKSKPTPDVALLVADAPATAAAVFTTNRVFAAPIKVGREHIAGGLLRAVVVNAGNANACTGKQGEADARRMCALAAELIGCKPQQVLPSSTGIIGHLLPMDKLEIGIRNAANDLGDSSDHATRFADAILTTDTRRKVAGATVKIGRQTVTIAGVCKGAGMIGPRLALDANPARLRGPGAAKPGRSARSKPKHATMLAYLTTDAALSAAHLRNLLQGSADRSFNNVTIDDHASTNDTCALLASGAGASVENPRDLQKFAEALDEVCQSLAYQIAADGEGATKVVKVVVSGAYTDADAGAMARVIANSPLVKCAMHGNDPNWGRIVSAAGYAGVPFDPDRATLRLQGTVVFRTGRPLPFDAGQVSQSLKKNEVTVDLRCGMGDGKAIVWTCDFSREYVAINADYHT